MENQPESNDSPICISQDDLAELRVLKRTENELKLTLAEYDRQLHALENQKADVHRKIDMFEPQIVSAMQRMQRKYGIGDSARINLETGAIE